ncbi:uncharacterized protein LOC124369317 [Homalodisca vitripennis]|uniref:uncharacterized protein LOC124369317 n=1 Tax=Homalodisca vitripennis TaxID=197043 RepID=UPI001EEC0BF3|nr:uncharacterized protein LOC124369317 [Homalodisca vitripennis]XP_046683223.1 uncharacterized protein LOC124369317 [Homalodisca vitripennis]XP_046683224.1 uncharacterized protein LOC124369317 [Homalodisca vitripennis]KAG8325660.1 hypothetical protein J6590_061332 [Homalodisca vitripennis]
MAASGAVKMSSNGNNNVRNSKRQRELEYCEKLRLIDSELMSFYQYCQSAGFTEAEMAVICAPLLQTVRRSALRRMLSTVLCLAVLCAALYWLSTLATVRLHFSAIGRILLIKMLPLWDWRPLFYDSCLMNNPFYEGFRLSEEDCVSCEVLDHVDRLNKVSYDYLLDSYLNRDAPFIVTDAMDGWPVMSTDEFYFDNITQLYLKDDKLIETVPCILTTNLRTGSSDLLAFLKRIHNPAVDKWFVHWQNCDIHAVKALRKFYQRPYFLSNSVSPAHFNWVLMSSDYNTYNYKKVELDSGLIVLVQLRGSTVFKLIPHNPCNISCQELLGNLHEGEMLVFTNFMWTFEYYPGHRLDSVAILTETVWDDNMS